MSNTANLYSVLNLEPIKKTKEVVISESSRVLEDDFQTARKNLHEIIKIGQEAFESLAIIANQSQSSDDYTGLSSLLNSLIQANRELLALSKKRQDFEKVTQAEKKSEGGDTINNNLFVGTTSDFLEAVEKLQQQEKEKNDK